MELHQEIKKGFHLNIESTFGFNPLTVKMMLIEDAELREAEVLKEWKVKIRQKDQLVDNQFRTWIEWVLT